MQVLFLTLDALQGVGGIQRFNTRFIRALAELGATGHVEEPVSLSLWDPPQTCGPAGVHHRGFGRRKTAFIRSLCRTLWTTRPDVVVWGHILLIRLLPLAKILSPRSRHALIAHGMEVWGDPRHRKVPPWEPAIVRWLDRIVSVSYTTADRMVRAYNLPFDQFAILPNAVDVPVKGDVGDSDKCGQFRVLTVTRLSAQDTYKGVDLVLRALPSVAPEREVAYTVVGDGKLRFHYEELARALGLAEMVHFAGRTSDEELEDWYRWADVFALPSTGEGFGIAYLEAWAHRLPVVAANEGGAAEVVTDGETGLLVEHGSAEAVAEALNRLARDVELRRRLGAAGRATVAAKYSHDRFRTRLVEILDSLKGI